MAEVDRQMTAAMRANRAGAAAWLRRSILESGGMLGTDWALIDDFPLPPESDWLTVAFIGTVYGPHTPDDTTPLGGWVRERVDVIERVTGPCFAIEYHSSWRTFGEFYGLAVERADPEDIAAFDRWGNCYGNPFRRRRVA